LSQRQLLGVTVGKWMEFVLFTFLGGILVTIVNAWWSAKEPHLHYTVSDPVQFSCDKLKVGIVHVAISNDGNKEAESLECSSRLKGTKIQEVKVSPEHLKASVSFKDDTFEVKLPMLNQGEDLQIS